MEYMLQTILFRPAYLINNFEVLTKVERWRYLYYRYIGSTKTLYIN